MSKKKKAGLGWEISKFMHEQGMGENGTSKCVKMLVTIGMNLTPHSRMKVDSLDDIWTEWQKGIRKTFWYKKIMRDASKDFVMKIVCEGLSTARAIWMIDSIEKSATRQASEQQLLSYIWLVELIYGPKYRPQGSVAELALKWHGFTVTAEWGTL